MSTKLKKKSTTPIKILVDAHVFDYSKQGIGVYLLGLYKELVKNKDLQITISAHNIDYVRKIFGEGFEYVKLPSKSKFKRLAIDIPKIIRKNKYDYAHFQYITPPIKECKFINTIHDVLFLDQKELFPFVYRFQKKILFKYSALKSDLIFSVSEYSKERISKQFNLNKKLIHLSLNGVGYFGIGKTGDENLNPEQEHFKNQKYILCVSRFEPRKNQLGLLQAYIDGEFYRQSIHLVFIGNKVSKFEYDYFIKVRKMVPKELFSYIHFFENVSFENLQWYLQNAEVFIYPSLAEGFGIPPLEAAINRTKVICSNLTAMAEFSFFRYHINPTDPETIRETLKLALEDDNYPFDLEFNQVRIKYNWKSTAKSFYEVIFQDFKEKKLIRIST